MNNLNIKTNFTCKKPPLHPNTPTGLRIKKKELETKLKKIKNFSNLSNFFNL